MRRFRSPRQPPFNDSDDTNSSSREPAQDTASDIFYPGVFDVFKVRHILRWKVISEGLPMEIVDMIMETAEYWPSIEARMDARTIIRQDHDRELLRTAPLCYDEAVCCRPSIIKPPIPPFILPIMDTDILPIDRHWEAHPQMHFLIRPYIPVARLFSKSCLMTRAGVAVPEVKAPTMGHIPGSMSRSYMQSLKRATPRRIRKRPPSPPTKGSVRNRSVPSTHISCQVLANFR
jgi:hypothetical protein